MVFRCQEAFITLAAVDFNGVVEFYQRFLDCDAHPYIANTYAEFKLPGTKLGVFKPKESHEAEFADSSQAGLSLCIEVDDLDRAIAHATRLGYPPPGTITTASHGREIYVYDPMGNRLILHESSSP